MDLGLADQSVRAMHLRHEKDRCNRRQGVTIELATKMQLEQLHLQCCRSASDSVANGPRSRDTRNTLNAFGVAFALRVGCGGRRTDPLEVRVWVVAAGSHHCERGRPAKRGKPLLP